MHITRFLFVLEICDGKPTYRKSLTCNLLVLSDLTLYPSFKVKRGQHNLKVLLTHLLLALEVWDGKPTYRKIMGWKTSGVVGFDLEPLIQDPTRTAKGKSAYNSLIIGPRGF